MIFHEGSCSGCHNGLVYEAGEAPPTLRCTTCLVNFRFCRTCHTGNCPECKRQLHDKKKTFPTNLFNAIKKGELEEVRRLFGTEGGDWNLVFNDVGETPLTWAAIGGKENICRFLVEECGLSVHARSRIRRTALIEMVRTRSGRWPAKLAELLSDSINEQDGDGRTALMFASKGAGLTGSRKGNVRVIKQLLKMGADPTLTDKLGRTALGIAMQENHASKNSTNQDVVDLLEIETVKYVALQNFNKSSSHAFSPKGVLLTNAFEG